MFDAVFYRCHWAGTIYDDLKKYLLFTMDFEMLFSCDIVGPVKGQTAKKTHRDRNL